MNSNISIPFYVKFAFIVIGIFAFISALYISQQIVVPLIYATILAILLNPLVNYFVNHRINRVVAISIAVTISILIFFSLIYFILGRLSVFSETYPKLEEKILETSAQVVKWFSQTFNIRIYKINAWIEKNRIDVINNMGGAIGQTISAINSILIIVVLLPVYLFMILYYKNLLLEFIRRIFHISYHAQVFDVLIGSKKIIQSYLIGLLVEVAIIAALNSIGLLLLGIEYAIVLGIIGALLNIIPYIGGVIATALPMIIAYITKDSSTYAFLVLILYLLIQFIDNHFIIPRVVASRVKLNALISIISVLAGGALWGVPGMFLSIPLTAIIKVICDHIEPLKPWGYLLGNIVPTNKRHIRFKRKKIKL